MDIDIVEDTIEEYLNDDAELNKIGFSYSGSTGFKCPKCNRKFTLPSNLTRHMRHNKICGVSKGFECSNCRKVFSLNATLKDHYQRCTAEDPYRFACPNCPKQFTFKSSLNKHLRGRCRILKKKLRSKGDQIYTCKYCGAEFFDNTSCKRHEDNQKCRTEVDVITHVCEHCDKTFTMKSSLSKHLKGRCKLMKTKIDEDKALGVEAENSSTSNNATDMDDEEMIESWLDVEDVIEECTEESEEYITDNVEFVEICNIALMDAENKFLCENEEEYSETSSATYTIQINTSEE